MTSMPVWAERLAPREEGRRKSEVNRNGARNHGVDLQLRISENLGILTQVARSENLRLPMGADGREICLRYISKVECDKSCTRSHAPLRGHTKEIVIIFIRGSREAMNKKRKFDGVGAKASHRGTWYACAPTSSIFLFLFITSRDPRMNLISNSLVCPRRGA